MSEPEQTVEKPETETTKVEKPEAVKKVEPIWVEATVNIALDMPRGARTLADPTSQWIKDNLRSGFLVRINPNK